MRFLVYLHCLVEFQATARMIGFRFQEYIPPPDGRSDFERLLDLFQQMLVYTSGDVKEALSWLNEMDREHNITTKDYGLGNFIEDLKEQGYIETEEQEDGIGFVITAKTERMIRQRSLDEIFGKLKKAGKGHHRTHFAGQGDEITADRRPYEFGDSLDQISMTDSLKNAQIEYGINDFRLTEKELEVQEREYMTQTSTVLMIDISHSMILYGEDRITPAKKVAMALAELITTRYPKDTLDIIVFGNDAWQIQIKDLPYLQVGPYHTNTIAGLNLAHDLLRKRRNPNKQIFMITDGKPTCMKEGGRYYKNSFGLDQRILNKTFNQAARLKRLNIKVTTFMIAQDPYLQKFVREFTQINNGKAFYTNLQGLGDYIFEDFERNRRKHLR